MPLMTRSTGPEPATTLTPEMPLDCFAHKLSRGSLLEDTQVIHDIQRRASADTHVP